MDKKEMRAEYERVYGKTAPISCEMFYNLSSEELKRSYKGCQIQKSTIIFEFDTEKAMDMVGHDIEMMFRNRLGRKISFSFGSKSFTVFLNPSDIEETGQYLTATTCLDRWLKGVPQDEYRQLEYKAYLAQEDWLNPDVVKRYHIKK